MIYFYTGVPGSGKSLHVAKDIYDALRTGKNVIANFNVDTGMVKPRRKKVLGDFLYIPNAQWRDNAYLGKSAGQSFSYIDGLVGYAQNYHRKNRKGKVIEGQTLLVLDECQELFNSRSWNRSDRLAWCAFFRQHRKYGYTVILISQDDKVIDKQIRSILDTEVFHRKVSDFKLGGFLLALLCGGRLFCAIYRKYGYKKSDAKLESKFYTGRKYYDFYNSYETF